MAVPMLPNFRPSIIFGPDGDPVHVFAPDADGFNRLAVNALIAGGAPDISVLSDSESQDLSAGSLTLLTAFAQTHRPSSVFIHFTDGAGTELALPSDQTLVIKHKSANGAAFDTEVERITLAAGTTNYAFYFPARAIHALDDEIEVTLTNAGAPAVFVRASVRAEG